MKWKSAYIAARSHDAISPTAKGWREWEYLSRATYQLSRTKGFFFFFICLWSAKHNTGNDLSSAQPFQELSDKRAIYGHFLYHHFNASIKDATSGSWYITVLNAVVHFFSTHSNQHIKLVRMSCFKRTVIYCTTLKKQSLENMVILKQKSVCYHLKIWFVALVI